MQSRQRSALLIAQQSDHRVCKTDGEYLARAVCKACEPELLVSVASRTALGDSSDHESDTAANGVNATRFTKFVNSVMRNTSKVIGAASAPTNILPLHSGPLCRACNVPTADGRDVLHSSIHGVGMTATACCILKVSES